MKVPLMKSPISIFLKNNQGQQFNATRANSGNRSFQQPRPVKIMLVVGNSLGTKYWLYFF
jgi:hypothetical protein